MKSVELSGIVACVITSNSRAERFISLVRDLLDTFWSEHPPYFVLTDSASPLSQDVLSFPGLTWVEVLYAGLIDIQRRWPHAKYVFHMLEDHCPLRSCDGSRIDRIFDAAIRNELDVVAFPTYSWPWNETDPTEFPDGLIRTWRRVETTDFDGEQFAVVPLEFFRYFQVQPSLWRFDYLLSACRNATALGISDAWAFEAMRWSGAGRHYVSKYDWPSVHHGFLAQGKLNPEAITYLDRKRAPRQHRALVRDAIGVESPLLFDALQILNRTKRLIGRSLAGMKKRVKN